MEGIMKRSTRILLAGLVIEFCLVGIGAFLINQLQTGAMRPTTSVAEAVTEITSTLGTVIGGLAGLLLVLYLVARMKERQQP
jgi:hypothetical protein